MSAQRLRDAAAKLRGLTQASLDGRAPGSDPHAWYVPRAVADALERDYAHGSETHVVGSNAEFTDALMADAAFIAAMSPAVALAVANLLEVSAPTWEKCEELAARMPFEPPTQGYLVTALALADGILGAES